MKSDQVQLHAEIEEKHWWFLGRRKIMRDLVRKVVPASRAATVVDVGCGTGANIAALAEDYSCVGMDASSEAIELARRRFPRVQFLCGSSAGDLGGLARRTDLFLLMDVLEHVADDASFLSSLVAAMKTGAHLLITVPAGKSLWSQHDVSFGHLRRYEREQLQGLWAGLPVSPRLVSYFDTFLYPIVRGLRAIGRLRGRAWGAAGTDLSLPEWPLNRVLQKIFASEGRFLVDLVEGRRHRGFPFGVSLIALLRREPGKVPSDAMNRKDVDRRA